MLRLDHVSRVYEVGDTRIAALDDVSLTIGDGEFIAIVGPSGSGKSTLLQILGLLDRPSEGTVRFDHEDVGALSDAERTRMRLETIGFVFQRFHLLNDLTAIENVALPMEAAGVGPGERYARAASLLRSVGLGERLDFRPSRLSGGQRQRVAIARALANRPRIIFADEPTGELHSEDKAKVIELFRQFQRDGRTIVMVTHDMEVAAVAERRIDIRDGRVAKVGDEPAPSPLPVPVPGRELDRPPPPVRPRRRRRRWLVGAALLVAILAIVGYLVGGRMLQPTPTPGGETVVATPKLTARGEVRPDSEATVRSLVGGVVTRLSAEVGMSVAEAQELARIRAPDGSIEVLTSPWRGTVTGVRVHNGDTVPAGSVVATVGDLSRLRIETEDVDEFLVPRVQAGQIVTITVDALPGRELRGRVRTVALETQRTEEGDEHYPVVIDLEWAPPELRPGMTVRVQFPSE